MSDRMDPDELERVLGRITTAGVTSLRALADLIEYTMNIRKAYAEASPEELVRILGEWTETNGPAVLEGLVDMGDYDKDADIDSQLAEYCRDPSNYFGELAKLALHCMRMSRRDDKFVELVTAEIIRADKTHEVMLAMARGTGGYVREFKPKDEK